MIVLDNSVTPGVVVSMNVPEDDAVEFVEAYQRATGKTFEVRFIDGEDGGVASLTVASLKFLPSFPSAYVEPVEVLPVVVVDDGIKSREVLALEAEARSKNPRIGVPVGVSSESSE